MAFRTIIDGIGAITESSPGVFDTTGIIAEDVTSLPNDLLTGSCVVSGMQVSATSPATNQVSISAGKAWVENDAWAVGSDEQKFWPVNNDAAELLTIPANASGNPRIDLVCVEVDPVASPGDDGAPNCDYVVVQGTPAGSPVAPAVPAKHTVLAQIAVANGFSTITSGNITDRRQFVQIQSSAVAGGGMWWEELARVSSHGSSATMTTSSFAEKKYLKLVGTFSPSTSADISLRFNGDSGSSSYGWRVNSNDGAATTNDSDNALRIVPSTNNVSFIFEAIVLNIADQRKTLNQFNAGTTTDAAHPSTFRRGSGRWANTSNQITTITLLVSSGVLNNAELIVMGHD